MKIRSIRESAFETNSSSTHSVVIKPAKLQQEEYDSNFHCLDLDNDGVLTVSAGEFGWEYRKYKSFTSKLSYLVTYIYYNNVYVSDKLSILEEVLKEHIPNFTKLNVENKEEGYVDHQSYDVPEVILQYKEKIVDFLFSSESILITDNDNH